MKEYSWVIRMYSFCLVFTLVFSCSSESNDNLPKLETLTVTDIMETAAKSGGKIESDFGAMISEKGVCWGTDFNPTLSNAHTSDGSGADSFESLITGLTPNTEYHIRAFATNPIGIGYGNDITFRTLSISSTSQIIADHTVVDKYDEIPQHYIDEVKKMWLTYPGESHSQAIRVGMALLESIDLRYAVSVLESGTPEAYTTSNLRVSRATWGDLNNTSGWIYDYGEEDWFTNSTAISRTKAGITYCNTHNISISVMGFGWCYDMINWKQDCILRDEVYGCYWHGSSKNGPEGDRAWGLNDADYTLTGNSVSMDTYLNATQQYIDHCTANGYNTKVFFTTGPVDVQAVYEPSYQGFVKHEYIRDYVLADPSRILFDYADILCYDDGSEVPNTLTWNGHTYPVITDTNLGDGMVGHIGSAGAIRLAKAIWWMLARIAGWSGISK